MTDRRLVVVANRLPVRRVRRGGRQEWETSPGGLVAALTPVLQETEGIWIGWSGVPGSSAPEPFEHDGIRNHPLPLTEGEVEDYYYGFCNGTLWPLYHDAVRPPEFHRHWWRPYVEVNRRFARAVAESWQPGDLVWVQDYHLQLVPGMVREACPEARIGFFLHIPFPAVELFAQIPWRGRILEGMLGADVVGFQTRLTAQNFQRAARRYAEAKGAGKTMRYEDRQVLVDRFPISIDFETYEGAAASPEAEETAAKLRADLGDPEVLVFGVDRLDYTKGIDIRLRALEALFERRPDLVPELVFLQVAAPSREEKEEYQEMRTRIEELVGRINGEHGTPEHVPIRYQYGAIPHEDVVQHYLAADVMLVTPLRDGMNLVAKEYVASRRDEEGVLVLSEFTGAVYELRVGAITVNPYDIDGVAAGLEEAVEMPPAERRRRMRRMRRRVRRNDVHRWARSFLEALGG